MTSRSMDLAPRLAFATALVREAGQLALGYFNDQSRLGVEMKGFQDYLTAADGAVESMLRQRLAERFPDDGFFGEEGGGAAHDAIWIADPIDGTANFARGDLLWCISLGYVVKGVPQLGILLAPAIGEEFVAEQGRGATRNGQVIRAATTADMSRAAIEIGWSARRPRGEYIQLVDRVMAAGATAKRSASGALGLAWTACGRTDGYLERHINSWDVAAGLLIAREAGAVTNDFFAGDWLTAGNPVLAATVELAPQLAELMGLDAAKLMSG